MASKAWGRVRLDFVDFGIEGQPNKTLRFSIHNENMMIHAAGGARPGGGRKGSAAARSGGVVSATRRMAGVPAGAGRAIL